MVLFQFVVRPDMLGEVIATHELFVALGTLEALLAGVRPPVSLQFIGPCEPLAAVHPGTDERPFTCMPPKMCPQMGRFPVHLVAPAHMADVLLLPIRRSFAFRFTVRTGAGHSPHPGFGRLFIVTPRSVSSSSSAHTDIDVHRGLRRGAQNFALDLVTPGYVGVDHRRLRE